MAKILGADEALPPDGPEFWDALADATDGRGADVTIETVGGTRGDTVEQAIEITRRQGRIVIVDGFRRPLTIDWLPPLLKEHSIVFSSCYGIIDGRHDYELAIDLMASGKSPIKQMVTHNYSLDDIQKGFDTAYDKTSGSIKVQILQ